MKREIFHGLSAYNPEWKSGFEAEKELLEQVFGDRVVEIEHIGSTAVEGLPSKPIVDIAVIIKNDVDTEELTTPLSKMGYLYHSKSSERQFYQKTEPVRCNLSIVYGDKGGFLPRQILFRDYLRSHPEARDAYAELKRNLIAKYPTGIGEYSEGKTGFVQNILALAGWKDGQTYSEWQSSR